ncbi:MAG TPA: S8 family serine peptidase [Acidimicrobiales bacterium]|nr:S8 family serine peptidase [Acidimicrobiales bacterium]
MHRRAPFHLRVLVAALVGTATLATGAPARATNDQHWGLQWGPQLVGVEQAFAAGITGAGVRIGIVDTGVDLSHPDLGGKIVANAACIDTRGSTANCDEGGGGDTDSHGTHVAGIAAAFKDNGVGISGVAPGANLVVARVFRGTAGNGAKVSDVNAGIKWVVDNGAKVVNLSLGDAVPLQGELFGSDSLDAGIQYAWAHGAVAVLAAGNTNYFGLGSQNYGNVDAVVVGATGRSDKPASYSSPTGNAKWALVAPGGDIKLEGSTSGIYSTLPAGGYGYLQGTSMAAPHVTAALALLMSMGQSNRQAVETLLATVNRSVPCGENSHNCRGRLDVACAVGRCASTATTTTAGTTTTRPPDGGSGGTQSGGTSGTGSSDSGSTSGAGSAPAPTNGSGGSSGSSGSPTSGGDATGASNDGGTAAAAGSSPARSTASGGRTGTGRLSGLAARFRPPATPAPPSADPAGAVPGDAVPPEQLGVEAPSELGEAEETPGRPLEAIELAQPSAVEERADPALATTAAGLLLLVSFAALRRRRRQPAE